MATYDATIVYPNRLEGPTIRLLELFADDGGEILQCRLKETPLDGIPVYEALSYVWGDPKNTKPICCNGEEMQITQNLASALRKLRFSSTNPPEQTKDPDVAGEFKELPLNQGEKSSGLSHKLSRMLWVDAICINQQNVTERSQQVQLMREIYSRATGVVVFLGTDEDGHASKAIPMIKKVNDYLSAYQKVVESIRENDTAPTWLKGRGHFTFDMCDAALQSHGFEAIWSSIRAFFQLLWWKRIWCVQEVYMAQTVVMVLGDDSIDGKAVAAFTQWYFREHVFYDAQGVVSDLASQLNDPGIGIAYNTFNHRNLDAKQLHYVCEDFKSLQATDPRDKVYGLLGLWRPASTHEAKLEVDYNKPVSEVYADVAMLAIRSREDLFVLRFVDHDVEYNFQKGDSFPSWVPRWDRGTSWAFAWLDKSPLTATQYKAEIPDQELAHSGVLSVKGVLFDRVAWASDVLGYGATTFTSNEKFRGYFLDLYNEATGQQNDKFPHQVSLPELASTVTKGLIKIGDEFLDQDIDDPNAWLDISDLETDTGSQYIDNFMSFINSDHEDGDASAFKKLLMCGNSRLFRTHRGHLGIGRHNLREGDFVAVLHGGRVPHMLRLHTEGFFSYVGDSFVYDIMQKQVYDMFEVEGVWPGVFNIH